MNEAPFVFAKFLKYRFKTDANNNITFLMGQKSISIIRTIHTISIQFKEHMTLRHIIDHFRYHFESIHVVGEIVLTGLQCNYPIHLAFTKKL